MVLTLKRRLKIGLIAVAMMTAPIGASSFAQVNTGNAADAVYAADLAAAEARVKRVVTVDLSQNEYDALISLAKSAPWAFDMKASPLIKDLNAGDRAKAADDFLLYDGAPNPETHTMDHPPEIRLRRLAERHMFLTGEYLSPQQALEKFKPN